LVTTLLELPQLEGGFCVSVTDRPHPSTLAMNIEAATAVREGRNGRGMVKFEMR
jgi:hypothetical protein